MQPRIRAAPLCSTAASRTHFSVPLYSLAVEPFLLDDGLFLGILGETEFPILSFSMSLATWLAALEDEAPAAPT